MVTYAHIDIEATGWHVSTNSMIQLGVVFTDEKGKELDSLSVCIKEIPGKSRSPKTMEWWEQYKKQWDYIKANEKSPEFAMNELVKKITKFKQIGKLRWVARPASFDWPFFTEYYNLYGPKNKPEIGHFCTCLSTMKNEYSRNNNISREAMKILWKKWTVGFEHTHDALDDAREQARAFHKIMEITSLTTTHGKMELVTDNIATTSSNTTVTNSISANIKIKMNICSGNDECLIQDTPGTYVKDESIECSHNCQTIKCPNFELCKSSLPKVLMDCYNGLCLDCDMMFGTWQGGKGKLNTKENTECPICLKKVKCISLPKCEHYVCIECMKRCWYGDKNLEPIFPYNSTIEDEYDDNPDDDKFKNDEKIIQYNQELDQLKIKQENLRKCSLCSK